MGRHSSPEPQDAAGEPPEEPQAPGGDYTDGGHDAPLSARGRILFWTTVAVLVLAIAALFVATLAR